MSKMTQADANRVLEHMPDTLGADDMVTFIVFLMVSYNIDPDKAKDVLARVWGVYPAAYNAIVMEVMEEMLSEERKLH